MGLFKRFFSLGSKKHKRSESATVVSPSENGTVTHATALNIDEPIPRSRSFDEEANRLLRSSSAHYKVVKEFDYHSIPPIPHPINQVLATASTPNLLNCEQEMELPRIPKSSYSVTVYPRQHIATTAFPEAYHEDSICSDSSRVFALQTDPALASLLNMFDEDGQIPDQVFSNSPPRAGKPRLHRTGSTLRQLLGDTSCGDISWAERRLGERDGIDSENTSPNSSLETPSDESQTDHTASEIQASKTFDSRYWARSSDPTIDSSSSCFEWNIEGDRTAISQGGTGEKPQLVKRASQIFSFLYGQPEPIRAASVEREVAENCTTSDTSSPSVSSNLQASTPNTSLPDCETYQEPTTPVDMSCDLDPSFIEELVQPVVPISRIPVPIKFIVTAPTPRVEDARAGITRRMSGSRIPVRSPGRTPSTSRPTQTRRISSHPHPYARALFPPPSADTETSPYDPFTAIPKRSRRNRHKASASTSDLLLQKRSCPSLSLPFSLFDAERENSLKFDSPPTTPIRPRVLDMARENPSPASSTELSPVGRQLMVTLRHQRMQARALERDRSKEGISH